LRYNGQPPPELDLSQWSEVGLWSEGDRVITPLHGAGTVLGPEFYREAAITQEGNDRWIWLQRWAVKLDDDHHYKNSTAYYWHRNLTKES